MPTTTKSLRAQIARSFGAPEQLTDLLPRLFAKAPSLGSWPKIVTRMLRESGLKPSAQVLEFACGNGATAVHIASDILNRTGHITGIDAHPQFIAQARALAATHNVQPKCSFIVSDVSRYQRARVQTRFDAAIMLNLFGCEQGPPLLRRWVRPRGVYIIDDAFRSSTAPPRFHHTPTLEACRAAIESTGDHIEQQLILPPRKVKQLSASLLKAQAQASRKLGTEFPAARPLLNRYLASVRSNSQPLGTHLRPTIWLVRRAAR